MPLGTFAHLPGMKVVVPSSPFDHKGLMAAAIESDDPVVYVEHKDLLLWRSNDFPFGGEVPEGRVIVPIGKGAIVRGGTDVTVVTLSRSVIDTYRVAETLASEGIDVEVIDLRSVVPLDLELILGSVVRTGRLVVVDEDYLSFGLSGEIVARALENLGASAIRAVSRVAVPDVPIPAAASLESAVVPREERIAAAIRTTVQAA